MSSSRAHLVRVRVAVGGACLVLAVGCSGSIAQPSGGASPAGVGPTTGGNAGQGAAPVGMPAADAEVPAGMRRLTQTEYIKTIHDLIDPSIKIGSDALDRDDPSVTFGAVGGYRIATPPSGVVKYQDLAYDIAQQVFASPPLVAAVVACDPKLGASCAQTFVTSFGRRAWRRPLTDAEVARYTKVIADVTTIYGAPEQGFQYALAGLLQSTNFIYLPEIGETANGKVRFTSYEMASRLSYLLTDTTPDAALSVAADSNELVTPEGLRAQIDRLIASPKARPSLDDFLGELIGLDQLAQLDKDVTVYPQATSDLIATMGDEARRMIDEVTVAKRNALFDVLDTRTAYVDADLAKLYGLPAPAAGTTGLQPAVLPAASERGGLLTTAAWLSIQAKPYSSSPTYRGIWIRENLLCQTVPSPPPGVMNDLPNPATVMGPPETTRQVLEMHRQNPVCATCHAFFDPIGVAFEHFDGIGAYRTLDQGLPIDDSGNLDGKSYPSLPELIALLKADARVPGCMVRQLFRFVSGHEKLPSEDAIVGQLSPGLVAKPDYLDLLVAMVTSDWFRFPAPPL